MITRRPLPSLFVLSLLGALSGCSSAPLDGSPETAATSDALSASAAVSRAEQWAHAALPYCQSPYGEVDPDDSCWSKPWERNHRCYREENGAWDAYRSDCSGLVSWAWGLGAPGRTTMEFAPFRTDVTHVIDGQQLRPGDAVNNSHHVMLFTGWVVAGKRATFIEEPGCGTSITHAHELTSDVSISGSSVYVAYDGMSFTAIRYDGLGSGGTGGAGGCVVGGLYCGGDEVKGDARTLYRCTGGTTGTVVEQCAAGCAVHSGSDDACNDEGSGGGGCQVGGLYCGGDEVSGDAHTLYRCTGGRAGTVVERCADGCSVNPGTNDSCSHGSSAAGGGHCVAGSLYCGGDKVTGNSGTLYECTSGSAGTTVGRCADGCEVRSGTDDACRGAGDCVVGGLYCGGDKVTGDPRTLYRCTGGSSGAVVQRCAQGCAVVAGQDDACR